MSTRAHTPTDSPSAVPVAERRSPVARLLLGAIRAYRYTAPARAPRCRYLPTCSEYAAEAIERFGPARGSWLALKRLGRCHPLGSHGLDPVPEK